jgi:hypothetical protein
MSQTLLEFMPFLSFGFGLFLGFPELRQAQKHAAVKSSLLSFTPWSQLNPALPVSL